MRACEHRKEKETNNNKINVQDKTYNNQEKRINRQTEQTKDETEEICAYLGFQNYCLITTRLIFRCHDKCYDQTIKTKYFSKN